MASSTDALPGIWFFLNIPNVGAGSKPAQKWFSYLPSRDVRNALRRHVAQECRISGRLHLVTSVCCARTPSPTDVSRAWGF